MITVSTNMKLVSSNHNSTNGAVLEGLTKEIQVMCGGFEMDFLVKPNTDFTKPFKVFDLHQMCFYIVSPL